jgi:Icc-related predicted phosphoesterase
MTAGRTLAFLTVLAAGCAHHAAPHATDLVTVAGELASRFDTVFLGADTIGLVRPRFGAPAVLEGAASFPVVVVDRHAGMTRTLRAALTVNELADVSITSCLDGTPTEGCIPLALTEDAPTPLRAGATLRTLTARPTTPPPLGAYNLVVRDGNELARQFRVVFVREPATDRALSVVQLSDLHVDQRGDRAVERERLGRVIDAVNALRPDVVVVTGDMAEQGRTASLEDAAAAALRRIEAPVLAVLGNHDYGHFPKLRDPRATDAGYYNFARAFHGLRRFRTLVGGWDFFGFDSGPSLFSVRIRTRGIDEETLRSIDEAIAEDRAASRGTVLFSHAPTRAALSSTERALGSNQLGSMRVGAHELERSFLEAERTGARLVHLSGHTHWSDVFTSARDGLGFTRVPFARLTCPNTFDAATVMVCAPSAARVTFQTLVHGRDFGFVHLLLGDKARTVQFQLYDAEGKQVPCPDVRPLAP